MRLLVVDDHDDTLEFMSRLLRARGHAVTTAKSVADAERACCDTPEPFDLAICDMELPDGTGTELMKGCLARTNTPAIALSGHGSAEDHDRSRAAGFAAHLTKPIALDALESAIRQAAATRSPKA